MSNSRKIVIAASLGLLGVWLGVNWTRISIQQDALTTVVLGSIFAFCLIVRSKPADEIIGKPAGKQLALPLIIGAVLVTVGAVLGQIFDVHQVQWLGLCVLVFVALRWALPPKYAKDVLLAVFVFYWVHPLPRQVFGPVQLKMQEWSVAGAEWMLHCINERVWADELTLYNGFEQITVPEACSGMSTGIVVAYTILGVALIFRLRWFETLFFASLGVAQVLLVNMFRIAMVTRLAPEMDPAWTENFLHDTLGLFLLGTILVSQVELSLYRAIKSKRHELRTGIESGELEKITKASNLPRFWYLLFKWGYVIVLAMVVTGGAAAAIYKSRPEHRREMRKGVIEGLVQSDIEKAEQAVLAALAVEPKDPALMASHAEILVKRGKFSDALIVFNRITGALSPYETVLKSYSLMSLGKPEKAIALIDELPERARSFPGVAMVRAEYAAYHDDPALAGEYLLKAAHTVISVYRIRALFPFLARHEQWKTIADSDGDAPYQEIGIAETVMLAQMRVNDVKGLQRTMTRALKQYPSDPNFLQGLFMLASRRPGSDWEGKFTELFERNIDDLGVKEIVTYMGYCFRLFRPDLGWRTYQRLLSLEPGHPDVSFKPAQFGNVWYVFRKRHLSLGGEPEDIVDLRPIRTMTQNMWPFDKLWAQVPLGGELAEKDLEAYKSKYLSSALKELKARDAANTLSRHDRIIYPTVLAAEGMLDEAHKELDELMVSFEELRPRAFLQHAELYDREYRWQESYEALRNYGTVATFRDIKADLLYINALLNLGYGVGALQATRDAELRFPDNDRVSIIEAAIWDIFGHDEQAFQMLRDRTEPLAVRPAARLAVKTGRAKEAERLHALLGVPMPRVDIGKAQSFRAPRAELAVTRDRWNRPPDDDARTKEAERYVELARDATSEFLRDFYVTSAQWLKAKGGGGTGSLQTWARIGRDPIERAVALHHLATMAARYGRFEQALVAIEASVEHLPQSPVLHRVLVALSEGRTDYVERAYETCPNDPDLWLASLVTRVSAGEDEAQILSSVNAALALSEYPSWALVRAGDYCLRAGMRDAASEFARRSVEDARGLVSPYVLALQCALQAEDFEWAGTMAQKGIEFAHDPTVFHKALVWIKTQSQKEDADLIGALDYLRKQFPGDTEWTEQLVHVFFQKGDTKRALTILAPMIESDIKELRVRSVRTAAEAARLEGERLKAIRILEKAYQARPDDLSLLNNLVYNLALVPEGIPRARQLLPKLIESGNQSFVILDTIAVVYLRSGDLDRARQFMDQALSKIDEKDYSAAETRLNDAELLMAMGRYEEAQKRINDVRKLDGVSPMLDTRAKRLLDSIRSLDRSRP